MLSQVKRFLQTRSAATVTEIVIETRLARQDVVQALEHFIRLGWVRQEDWSNERPCETKCNGCSLERLCETDSRVVKAFVWNVPDDPTSR